MKASWEDDYEMPDEIDLSKMRRIPNPMFQKFRELNLVSLDFDVAEAFPDSAAVNAALRRLMAERKQDAATEVEFAKAS